MTAPDDPTALAGEWRLERTVDDRRAGRRTEVVGTLTLAVETPGRLSWVESGTWHLPAGPVPVRRVLYLDLEPHGWWVRFEDGRPFHPWRPGETVVHPCGADTYTGLVTGESETWTVRWDVQGPEKDYTMTTRLIPRRDGAAGQRRSSSRHATGSTPAASRILIASPSR